MSSVPGEYPAVGPEQRAPFLSAGEAARREGARPRTHRAHTKQRTVTTTTVVALVVGPLADTSRAGANPVRDESQHGSRLGPSPKSTFPKYVPGRDRELVKHAAPARSAKPVTT